MATEIEKNEIYTQNEQKLDFANLKSLLESQATRYQAVEAICELAKHENHRLALSQPLMIDYLLDIIHKEKNTDQVALAIRALSNICYENKLAANLINDTNIDNLVALFKDPLNLESIALISNITVLLINLIHGNENLPKIVLKEHNILSTIEDLLRHCLKESQRHIKLLNFLLAILNGLTDYLEETQLTFSENILCLIIEALKIHMDDETISSVCVEIIHEVMDMRDENKTILAKAGACEVLYSFIEKARTKVSLEEEECAESYQQACDSFVVILTDDASMDLLYENGKGKTYQNMLAWLNLKDKDNGKNKQLLTTAILAMGNFARKDSNCIEMVKNGVSKRLIDILKDYNTSTDIKNVNIQHGILSTLKNLSIPNDNKNQIIRENIIEVLYPMLKQDCQVIVFKLLGTFRMLSDGEEKLSMDLLSKDDFIERLCYWCYNSDHVGVRGEIPRLFSWLIKNCHSSKYFPKLTSYPSSIKCIVEMISSNHAIMHNEAYFSLMLLAKGLETEAKEHSEKFYDVLTQAPLGKHLNFAVKAYGLKWDEHTTKNHLSLVKCLIRNESVLNNLKDSDYFNTLKCLECHTNTEVSKEVQGILVQVQN